MNINKENVLDTDEWVSEMEFMMWGQGVMYYKVTEDFIKRGKCTYVLRGLNIDIEDDVCICYDMDNILFENNYIFNQFLVNNVNIYKDDTYKFMLHFKDGNIIVEGLLE